MAWSGDVDERASVVRVVFERRDRRERRDGGLSRGHRRSQGPRALRYFVDAGHALFAQPRVRCFTAPSDAVDWLTAPRP